MRARRKRCSAATALLSALVATAVAADPLPGPDPLFDDALELELEEQPSGFPDPLEGANRRVLRFNRGLDRVLFDPITKAYGLVTPDPVKRGVRRAFRHIGSVPILFNDLLQLNFDAAGVTFGRLVVNSFLGAAGFLDPAEHMGMPRHESVFGQTLAMAKVGSGPYLVLPVLGPMTVRDGVGDVVDGLLRPTTYVLGTAEQLTYGSGAGLSTREEHYDALKALDESSVDYYAALRNAYYQTRIASIQRARERRELGTPEYDELAKKRRRRIANRSRRWKSR